jgi:hypothetical protein
VRYAYLAARTSSNVDLRRTGAWRYSRDPTTSLQVLACIADVADNPAHRITVWNRQGGEPMPALLKDVFDDPAVVLRAFNAMFMLALCESHCVHTFAPERWECAQVLALSYGLPTTLDGVVDALKLHSLLPGQGEPLLSNCQREAELVQAIFARLQT